MNTNPYQSPGPSADQTEPVTPAEPIRVLGRLTIEDYSRIGKQ
jgi:hypothetical protein